MFGWLCLCCCCIWLTSSTSSPRSYVSTMLKYFGKEDIRCMSFPFGLLVYLFMTICKAILSKKTMLSTLTNSFSKAMM